VFLIAKITLIFPLSASSFLCALCRSHLLLFSLSSFLLLCSFVFWKSEMSVWRGLPVVWAPYKYTENAVKRRFPAHVCHCGDWPEWDLGPRGHLPWRHSPAKSWLCQKAASPLLPAVQRHHHFCPGACLTCGDLEQGAYLVDNQLC